MTALIVTLYIAGAVVALSVGASLLALAIKNGPTIGGLTDFLEATLQPRKAWMTFGALVVGVGLTTTASVLSVLPSA